MASLMCTEPPVARAPADTWIRRHKLIFYFALAYAISWPLFLLSRLTGGTLGTVFIVIGAFGPPLAAAITIRYSGESLSEWLRAIVRWRVPVRLLRIRLGLPVLIMAVMNAALATLGHEPDMSQLAERIPAYLQTFLLTAVIFGGQEEPGGALRPPPVGTAARAAGGDADLGLRLGCVARSAVRSRVCGAAGARLLLQLAVQPNAERLAVHPVTRQLHACPDHLLLTIDSRVVDVVLLGTYVVGASVLIAVTRGRLGYRDPAAE